VEVKRGQDFNNPGSQDQDPIFSNYRLPKHEARAGRHKKTDTISLWALKEESLYKRAALGSGI
jgi:hypothetical protein